MGKSTSDTAKILRFVVVMLALGCFLLGAAATGAYLAVSHIVKTTVVDYAKALGIALEPTEVRFGLSFVQVLEARFTTLEVPGVSGTVQRITVDLSGLSPKRVLFSGITLNVRGDPLELKESALRYWERLSKNHSASDKTTALPEFHWQHLTVNLTDGNPLVPTAALTELTVVTNAGPTHDERTIRAASTHVGELDLGSLEFATRYQDNTFELGFGPTLHESKWRVAYRDLAANIELRFSFQPLEATELLRRIGGATTATQALRTTKLQGHVEALHDKASGRTSGSITLDLTGFTPPYPPELKGYKFADTSAIRATFEIDPQFLALVLRGIEVKTGELSLVGHGKIVRDVLSLQLRAELATTLDCVTLAKGWASEQLGGELGRWAAKNAPKAVNGSVSVKVQLDADSSHLDQAKVIKRIGNGCGLQPMSLVDLLNLGLPPIPDATTVERLIKQIPTQAALSNLPKLPQLLPPFEGLALPGMKTKPSEPSSPKKTTGAKKATTLPKAAPSRQ